MIPPRTRPGISVYAAMGLALLGAATLPSEGAGGEADDTAIRIVVTSAAMPTVRPGGQIVLTTRVLNLGEDKRTLLERVRFPGSWKSLKRDSLFTLVPGGSDIRLLSFHIPATASAGEQGVVYALYDAATGEPVSEERLSVQVEARRDLQIIPVETQPYAASGRPYTATFSIRIEGNAGALLFLKARSSASYRVDIDPSLFYLVPGNSRLVHVTVTTPGDLVVLRRDLLTLSATVDGDSLPAAISTVAVDVLPVDGRDSDVRHLLPASAVIRSAGEDGSAGLQGEFGVHGTLFPKREGELEVLIRTPDLQRRSLLGPLDEYRLRYEEPTLALLLGDHTYELSPLTEFGRYAFGGAASISLSEFTLGGFYNRTRLSSQPQDEVALFAALNPAPEVRLSLQAMGKEEPRRSSILSFRTLFWPLPNSTIDAEIGRSYGDRAGDDAFSLRWYGRGPLVYYDLRYMRAGADYTGYFRDLDLKSANLIVYPWSLLRVEVLLREEGRNLARSDRFFGAPRQLLYEAGAGFGNLLYARIRRRKMEDQMPEPLYGRDELTYLVRGGYAAATVSALAEAELGTYRERIFATEGAYARMAVFFNLFPAWFHSYGATLEYADEPDLYSGLDVPRWAGSISARFSLTRGTHLYLALQENRVQTEPARTFTVLEGALDHDFDIGHSIRFRARYASYSLSPNGREFSWVAEYTVPFELPAGRVPDIGAVKGRVAERETGRGIPDVVLTIGGQTVLSDADGDFAFRKLGPGMHRMMVDVTTLGRGKVLEWNLDNLVPVRGGEDTHLELWAARAGEIAGRMTLGTFALSEQGDTLAGEYVDVGGVPGALLEASRGEERVRVLTDSRGQFRFRGLLPGTWSIRVLQLDVPPNHTLERSETVVDLIPGDSVQASFRVLPRRRVIRILDQGHLLQR